ncbi:cadherin-like domain-containing protein [Colwellia sp. BRX10-3]|nr:Ig-like domain-containing protein [Colwellia sp. BRX10-3]MBA6392106.1 cadherin-like domain-containing protein [Colwellia sp. BRX10-3]
MNFSKLNTALKTNARRPLKLLTLSLGATLVLTGCNDGYKERSEAPNVAPTTITVDLITQTETPITDMLSATDADGDGLSFSLSQQAMLGVVTVAGKGGFTYQPNDEVTGSDSFTFSVTDGVNGPVTGTVNITIEALEVSFASYSRAAFSQQSTDKPLSTNGRAFIQDVEDPTAYDDLLPQ